jgi:hypothetical protein
MIKTERVISFGFNQDKTCFYMSTDKGYKIYSSINFTLLSSKNLEQPIRHMSMYYKSNLLFLVGVGNQMQKELFQSKSVYFWDDVSD